MSDKRFENLPAIAYDPDEEPTRVITLRLPPSTHRALRDAAHGLRVSLNTLVLSKVISRIDGCEIRSPIPTSKYPGKAARLREENAKRQAEAARQPGQAALAAFRAAGGKAVVA